MTDIANEPPRAHVRIVYLGPVSPHWELYSDYGDRTVLEEFRTRVMARLVLLPRDDPQFRRNRERIVRDAERERISLEWDLGIPEGDCRSTTMTDRLLNRELSWLDYNRRVLALAHETGIAPLERLKFVAICSSNLDEFFQVRISALKDQVAAGVSSYFTGGLTPSQQLAAIVPEVEAFVIEQEKVLLDVLVPELAARGVQLVSWDDLSDDDK